MRIIVSRPFWGIMTILACAVLPQVGQAARAHGFEPGDPPVISIGDAGPKVGAYNSQAPREGTMQFLLTTLSMTAQEDSLGSQAGGFAVTNLTLQGFMNNASLPAGGQEGSGVLIPFTVVSAEDTLLTFDADFLSNEIFQDPAVKRDDFAFYAVFNSLNTLQGTVTKFASVNGSTFSMSGGSDPFQFHTEYQTYAVSLSGFAPGNYVLGIGVEDAGGTNHASALLLDNVQVVPEPSVFALVAAGAGLMLGLRRRIKRS